MRSGVKLVLAFFCFAFFGNTSAQIQQTALIKRTCNSQVPPAGWDQWFNEQVHQSELKTASYKSQSAPFTIPVVVHVIHGGQLAGVFPNISSQQINSQIAVLNADFAGTGYKSDEVPSPFDGDVANCNITFKMAMLDPSGKALQEPGIHRVDWHTLNPDADPLRPATSANFQAFFDSIKALTIWDPSQYFNIWVSDVKSSLDILGYATFPAGTQLQGMLSGLGTSKNDGVWILASAFGSTGQLQPLYNKGRTATHEIGHWLGLRHIWGDSNCGNDFCADTPPQQTSNYSCPVFPKVSCGNGPSGDMFMNFMDYCDDECLSMFTWNQRTRMQVAMEKGLYRKDLTASSATLCDLPAQAPLAMFTIPEENCANSFLDLENQSIGMPGPMYSWSIEPDTGFSISHSPSSGNLTLAFTSPGSYNVTLVASNGSGQSFASQFIDVEDCNIPAGLRQPEAIQHLKLMPNPSRGQVTIKGAFNPLFPVMVQVYNALGEVVFVHRGDAAAVTLELGSLPAGIYFAEIRNGPAQDLKKIMLDR